MRLAIYGHPVPDDELDADMLDEEQYEALLDYDASLRIGVPTNITETKSVVEKIADQYVVKHPGHPDQKVHGRKGGGRLLHDIVNEGGFTYRPASNASPKRGFALSIFQDREFTKDIKDLTADDVRNYIRRNSDILKSNKDAYVGGWHDTETGKVYLDISLVLTSKKKAIALAKKHNQEGIYDLGRHETIITKADGDRRKEYVSIYEEESDSFHAPRRPFERGYRELLERTPWL